jgi:methionine-rich copper-binding protein CopC
MEATMTRSLRIPLIALSALLVTPGAAVAHAELTGTSPEAGAELDSPPTEVVMTFDGELDPEASGFVVSAADGSEVGTGEVDLEIADRNELRGAVEIAEPGEYEVSWTAVAGDGHPEAGSFTFTVADPDASLQQNPDTAMPSASSAPGPRLPVLVGLGLLAIVAVTVASRAAILVRGR